MSKDSMSVELCIGEDVKKQPSLINTIDLAHPSAIVKCEIHSLRRSAVKQIVKMWEDRGFKMLIAALPRLENHYYYKFLSDIHIFVFSLTTNV